MKSQFANAHSQILYHLKRGRSLRPVSYAAIMLIIICGLALLVSACASPFTAPAHGSGTPNATDTSFFGTETSSPAAGSGSTVTPQATAAPVINFTINNCPALSVNWDALVGTHAGVNKVQNVTCGPIENGATAAVVSVRYYTSNLRLDFYVYDNLGGTPTRRFGVSNLIEGLAQISPSNTIMTAEAGPNSIISNVTDLFKEYQWNGTTFAQIMFPGFYPDMTHFQAEQSENGVRQANNLWKLNASSVVNELATKVFHWPGISMKAVTYSDPKQTYIFQVTNLGLGGGGFTVQLMRLDNNIANIFEVTNVYSTDSSAQVTAPAANAQVTSPVTVSGSSAINGSVLGRVVLFDDTYTTIGSSNPIPSSGASGSIGTFSLPVSYRLNAAGMQEGVVTFFTTNQSNIAYTNEVVMVKVFFVG